MKVRTTAAVITGVLLIIIAGVLAVLTVDKADADAPPLRDRVVICREAENGLIAERLPCVWLAPLQGDRTGHSLIAYESRKHPGRLGLIRWLDDDRARFLWVAAVERTEVQGSNGGPLYERVNICVDSDGGSASSLPCVWHSPTMTGVAGDSYVVRRSGRHLSVTDAEARRLLLVVAYRR